MDIWLGRVSSIPPVGPVCIGSILHALKLGPIFNRNYFYLN